MPEENTGLATESGNTPPVSEPVQNPAPTTPTQTSDGRIPVAQYQGLQRNYIKMQADLKAAQSQLAEATAFSGTLQEQLGGVQTQVAEIQQSQVELREANAVAQRDNQFWNLVATDFPQLIPLAPTIRRVDDAEQQKAILAQAASIVGAAVVQQANSQVAQALQGVTPGQSPAPGGATPAYDRGDLYERMAREQVGSPEYKKLKAMWDSMTADDPKKLHPEWTDRLQSDWEAIEAQQDYLEPRVAPGVASPFLPNPSG